MTVNRTTLLDLPLPVTGTESGTWGDTTNNGLTQYLDIAIAGTLVLSTDADVTLTSTEGDSSATNIGATTAQYAILRWTATGSTTRNITALAQSKTYVVINATGGTQSIVLRGAGPTTGVTIISGEKAFCVWNGSDFVKVSSSAAAGGSNTQVQYNSSGVLAGSSNLTFDGTSLTLGGNPTLSAGTANGVLYLNGSKVATSGSALTFDGTEFKVNAASGNVLVQPSNVANAKLYMRHGSIGNNNGFEVDVSSNTIFLQAGSEAMRLTSTGLGIGTSSPAAKLHVQGTYGYFADGTYNGYFGKGNGVVVGGGAADLGISTSTGAIVFGTGGSLTERMRLDSSGNLGLGVTPNTWYSGTKAVEIGATTALMDISGQTNLYQNAYLNAAGSLIYKTNNYATQYRAISGQHQWFTAPSGTAGNAITFTQAMTLDASGNLGLGVTPSAWDTSVFRTLQVGTGVGSASLSGRTDGISNIALGVNFYYGAGAYRYIGNGTANYYNQQSGVHSWHTAASGTAGNAITFTQALTLDASGNLLLGGTSAGASSAASLAIFNGTAPTGSVTNGIILYAEDVSSSSELKVRDEAGNVTTLSPHNFSLIPDGPSEDMAWAYYSEKGGKRINVDMLKLARMVEKLTGEKLVYES